MLHILKRHPLPFAARFEKAVALTYAFPQPILTPLLSPGLVLDTYQNLGFVAVTVVHTTQLRLAFLPGGFGRSYFLTNYRLFTRLTRNDGVVVRGLQTLRSDTDSSWLAVWGNRMTRYGYRLADIEFRKEAGWLQVRVKTPHAEADLQVTADVSGPDGVLPKGSPFPDVDTARRFAGPLPYTFDYEPETKSIIGVECRRDRWEPIPVSVEVKQNTFLEGAAFSRCAPVLAGAFFAADVACRWGRGHGKWGMGNRDTGTGY